jgi:tripartite ATP-independent transporter DctP family solute receptor
MRDPYKMLKSIFWFTCVFIILLVSQNGCRSKKQDTYHFKLGHLTNEDHTWHQATIYFDSLLNARTNGRVRVSVYPSEQLGKEVELIRSIKAEIADMTITAGTLQNWSPIAAFTDMPFLLRTSDHLQAMVNGEIGKYLEETILEETGLRVLCYFQRGPRYLTSNRPIRHPDDLNGMIIRVPNVPSYVVAWQALGAKPTPMAFTEVFTSLQQGTVEAQENPMAMISSAKFSEVQDYLNLTAHVISWIYVVIGEKQFQDLPPDLQTIFLKSAKDMQKYEHQLFLRKEKLLQKELQEAGMEFIKVDQKAFQKAGSKAVYESLDDEMKKIYQQITELSED